MSIARLLETMPPAVADEYALRILAAEPCDFCYVDSQTVPNIAVGMLSNGRRACIECTLADARWNVDACFVDDESGWDAIDVDSIADALMTCDTDRVPAWIAASTIAPILTEQRIARIVADLLQDSYGYYR